MEKGLLIDFISEIVKNLFGSAEVIMVMWGILCCRVSKNKIKWCIGIIVTVICSCVYVLTNNVIVMTILSLIISFILVIFCVEEKFVKKLFLYLFAYYGVDIIYECVVKILSTCKIYDICWGRLHLYSTIENIIVIGLSILCSKILLKRKDFYEWIRSVKITFYLIETLCMISISAINSLIRIWIEKYATIDTSIIDTLRLMLTASLYILCFCLAKVDFNRLYYKNDSIYKDEILKISKEHFKTLERQINETRRIRHDMNAHYTALDALISKRDFENAKCYLDTIREHQLKSCLQIINTGNELVDAVISDISEQHSKIGIKFTGQLGNSVIKDFDLCVIFSNLVKNAFEAAEYVESEDKEITIEIKHYDNIEMITVKNPVKDISNFDVSKLGEYTTKSNSELHGFGIYNVRKVVESYEGKMDFSVINSYLVANIMVFDSKA